MHVTQIKFDAIFRQQFPTTHQKIRGKYWLMIRGPNLEEITLFYVYRHQSGCNSHNQITRSEPRRGVLSWIQHIFLYVGLFSMHWMMMIYTTLWFVHSIDVSAFFSGSENWAILPAWLICKASTMSSYVPFLAKKENNNWLASSAEQLRCLQY